MPKVERVKPERVIFQVGDFVRVRKDAPCFYRYRNCRGEVVQVVGHRTRLRINGQVAEILTDYLVKDGAQ